MARRPVARYRFKGQADGSRQFGLVAEEVEDVLPDLVVRNATGEVEAVSYHEMPAMLLNELQKQQKTIEQQAKENECQDALITELLARLAAIEESRAANGGRQEACEARSLAC